MFQLLDSPFQIEEEAPALDIAMPRVYRRPKAPLFARGKAPIDRLVDHARQAVTSCDGPGFGAAYGELVAEFQPAIQWALSCWEYLLSTQGCRFIPRTTDEKRYSRGDYRVYTENDFHQQVHRPFKECLYGYLGQASPESFAHYLRGAFWPALLHAYQALENPPDPNQRPLTAYSYLRCVPYQFLNDHHQERVTAAVNRLPAQERHVVRLYYFHFYKEEMVAAGERISQYAFWRRRALALRKIAGSDYLSFVLLTQIERY